jgi:D-lactate dehydrogenase
MIDQTMLIFLARKQSVRTMKITVFSANAYELPYLKTVFEGQHEMTYIQESLTEKSVLSMPECDAVMIFTSDNGTASILKIVADKRVKFIALRSVGFDHIDLKAARTLLLKVANVPGYSPYAVAEHAVLLLMALNRRLLFGQSLLKKNDFRLNDLTGFDVHDKTVGIIGLGRIGKAFSKIMNGFGCKVLCYDPYAPTSLQAELNIRLVNLSKLCAESDIISIHCPLNNDSRHLFNKSIFSQLKKNVYLINTARGPIIKTVDLLEALNNNLLGGVGLDVYEFEKGLFFQDHGNDKIEDTLFEQLRAHKKVIITGHQAFLTETALKNIAETCLYNLNCFAQGIRCENELHSS